MKTSKLLLQQVGGTLENCFQSIGFEKRKWHIYVFSLNEHVSGWLGLNKIIKGDFLDINPVIGVTHKQVEDIFARLAHLPRKSHPTATLSSPLGYLTPQNRYATWRFEDGLSDKSSATNLSEILRVYGLPFMQQHTDLQAICRTMSQSRHMPPDLIRYRLPIIYELLGQHAEAIAHLNSAINIDHDKSHPAAAHFSMFAQAFKAKFCKS